MPTYRITGPDGHTYKVEAPEGTTEDELMAEVEKQAGPAQPAASVPAAPRTPSVWDAMGAPEAQAGGQDLGANARVGEAMAQGFQNTPPILTPAAREAVEQGGPMGRYVVNPVLDVGSTVLRGLGGLGAGVGAGIEETARSVGLPGAGRDVNQLLQVLPAAGAGMPHPSTLSIRVPERGPAAPRFMHEVTGEPNPFEQQFGPPRPPTSPEFVPPGQPGSTLPRILDLIRKDEAVGANKPEMIPPRTATDPVTGQTTPIQQPPPVPEPGPTPRQNTFTPPPPPPPPPGGAGAAPGPRVPTPTTAAEATAVANTWYKLHEDAGGAKLPTDFTNNFIDTIRRTAPQTEEGLAFAGETEVTKLIGRAEALRDKPISLAGAQEIDEALGNLIDKQYGIKGLSKEGEQLLELQHEFREQLMNAAPAGDAGAVGGVEALKQGRRAWAQSRKMDDLERMQNRAQIQDHPDTGIRRQIRDLLANKKRSRGYSEEEKAALRRAANRGVLGGTMHVFGSRLVPLIAGGSGLATGGLPGMLINAGIGHGISSGMRFGATGLANRRVNRAMRTLGSSVPMPTNQMMPPP